MGGDTKPKEEGAYETDLGVLGVELVGVVLRHALWLGCVGVYMYVLARVGVLDASDGARLTETRADTCLGAHGVGHGVDQD